MVGVEPISRELGSRYASKFTFNQVFSNASLAALWIVVAFAIAGPNSVLVGGVPRLLVVAHILLALHAERVVSSAYFMALELRNGGEFK